MNSRELVKKTIAFESPERLPRHLTILPWAEKHYPGIAAQLQRRFPNDIVVAPAVYNQPTGQVGDRYTAGIYIDEWGCVFHNSEDGIIGIPQRPLVSAWSDMERLMAPAAMLSLSVETVNDFCRGCDKFVLAGTSQRPFERLQFIRTMEAALPDLLEEPSELDELLRLIHEFYLQEVELWSRTDVDAVCLMDDWGTQVGLLASPRIFRKQFKPMYREYVEVAHHYGKYVFMHSDGFILDIIPDFIEIGIDALNAQVFCMGVQELGDKFRGEITFWGEMDRQYLLPYGSSDEIKRAAREVFHHLHADGGFIAQSEFGPGAKPENIITLCETWGEILGNKMVGLTGKMTRKRGDEEAS